MVQFQLLVPRWLKNFCVETAKARGKSLSDWVRDVFVAQAEADKDRRPTRRQRG